MESRGTQERLSAWRRKERHPGSRQALLVSRATCLTSQPVKRHRENLANEHGAAGSLQRVPLKSSLSFPCTSRLEVHLCPGRGPRSPSEVPPVGPDAAGVGRAEDSPHHPAPNKIATSTVETRGAPGGLRSLPGHPPARRPPWSPCEARHTPSCRAHRWCCPRVNPGMPALEPRVLEMKTLLRFFLFHYVSKKNGLINGIPRHCTRQRNWMTDMKT